MPQRHRTDPRSGPEAPRYPGTFLQAVQEVLAQANWQVQRWQGPLIECTDAKGESRLVGLENLYRRARRRDRADWPALIADFLQTILTVEEDESLATDLTAVAERILVRLGTPIQSLPQGLAIWSHHLADTGLTLNLVIDFDNRMHYVTEPLIADSGQSGADWLARGMANLRLRTPADCLEVVDAESGMRLCAVGDAYDSARALLAEELMTVGPDGLFITIPGRDQWLALPVTAAGLANVHLLKILADKEFRQTPYPISEEVFWVRQGAWQLFPIALRGQEVTIRPPENFYSILDRLEPPEDEE